MDKKISTANKITTIQDLPFMSIIFEISQMITDTKDLSKLFHIIIDVVVTQLDGKAGSLMLFDPVTECLQIKASRGIEKSLINEIKIKPGEGIAGAVFKEGKPKLLKGDVTPHNLRYKKKITSAISVPIRLRNNIMGVINISRMEGLSDFTEDDERLAVLIANQTALAIENARLHTENKTKITKLNVLNKNLEQAYTDLEEFNDKLKNLQLQLVQSEKLSYIGQLAAGIAHEINNPIGFVASNINTLSDYMNDFKKLFAGYDASIKFFENENSSEEAQKFIQRISDTKKEIDIDFLLSDFDNVISESVDGIDRVKKIIRDLKEFSHVDKSEIKEFNINEGIESTLNIIWNELKYKATVKKEYGDIPEITCYPQQVNQVFMNIIINASQAIVEKGEITIQTKKSSSSLIKKRHEEGFEIVPVKFLDKPLEEADYIEVTISDTGGGIPKEIISKIFDPFFTTKEIGKGTGLGLSISFGIVVKHHGYIGIKSIVGQGTTFVIFLPIEFIENNDDVSDNI